MTSCSLEGQDVVVVVDDGPLDDDVADDLVVTSELVDQVFPSGGTTATKRGIENIYMIK